MMRFDKFSERAQDIAARAAEIIQRYGHTQIDTEHLMLALIEQPEGMVSQILDILKIDAGALAESIDHLLRTSPKANIFAGTTGQVFMTPRVKMAVDLAKTEAGRFGDEYISTEHLFLAILAERNTALARILESYGVNHGKVLDAVTEIRSGKKVSETRESTQYKTLDKFSRNLTQAARDGKLDPIYGREVEISRLIQILCRRTKNNPVLIG